MFDKRAVFLILIMVSAFFANQIYAQGPNIKFDVDTADFGVIADGDSVVYDFWFTNIGTDSAFINQAYPACGCTYPTYTQGKIKVINKAFQEDLENYKKQMEVSSMKHKKRKQNKV